MKKILLFILLFSKIASAQNINTTWKLYAGDKLAIKGVAGSLKEFAISPQNNAVLKLKCYPNSNLKGWMNTLIIMDTNRVEITRKNIVANDNSLIIKKEYLSSNNKVVVHITSKPTDPKLAAKIRVKAVPLVAIKLLN